MPANNVQKQPIAMPERIFLSPPHMGGDEIRFVEDAFASNYIAPLGPQVDAFEREFSEYTGIKHCAALSSGTAAIHLALQLIGVQPGDEVFASTLTFIGSVTPVTLIGATPVFIDCERKSWNLDPDILENELEKCDRNGKLPKAVIPTDLYGQCADYDRIYDICAEYEVPVVADAAEALGALYRKREPEDAINYADSRSIIKNDRWIHAGKGARAAIFSFNGNKIITTSGGGMLASDDEGLIAKARFLSQQARDPFPHYEHSEIGYNYRMSNISAAIGLGQLRALNRRVTEKRKIFNYYKSALKNLPGIEFMPEAIYGRCTRWLTVILITPSAFGVDRETVRLELEAENIESRPVWKPMHLQPVFDICANGNSGGDCNEKKRYAARAVGGTVSEDLFKRGLCLPSGTAMSRFDLDRVIRIVRRLGARRETPMDFPVKTVYQPIHHC
jgi:dTDP-4-amino-4,6-dideoxygalactose transaminase